MVYLNLKWPILTKLADFYKKEIGRSDLINKLINHGRMKPRKNLRIIQFNIVEHCNLNCFGCDHFSPLADKEFLDINIFERDIKRMAELTNGDVDVIELYGGEPLLHPDLPHFFEIARKSFPRSIIKVTTNGLLLLSQKNNFWDGIKENRIEISASRYPGVNWDKIEVCAKNHGCKITFQVGGIIKHSWKLPLDLAGSQNPDYSYRHCWFSNNWSGMLVDGRISSCEVRCIRHFNKYFGKDLPISGKDSIDIYKVNDIKEILDFLSKPIPFCRFCDVKNRVYDLPWQQSEKAITEWVDKE